VQFYKKHSMMSWSWVHQARYWVTVFSDLLVCCSWIQKSIWAKLCYFEANHCKTQPKSWQFSFQHSKTQQ